MTVCPECGSNNLHQGYASGHTMDRTNGFSDTYTYTCLECNCTFDETYEIKIGMHGQKDNKKCPHCGKSLNIT